MDGKDFSSAIAILILGWGKVIFYFDYINNCNTSEINYIIFVNIMRESLAAHFIEIVTDLKYIQENLDHKNFKITEVDTHISIKSIGRIRSPFGQPKS